jgi:hypothetical protein
MDRAMSTKPTKPTLTNREALWIVLTAVEKRGRDATWEDVDLLSGNDIWSFADMRRTLAIPDDADPKLVTARDLLVRYLNDGTSGPTAQTFLRRTRFNVGLDGSTPAKVERVMLSTWALYVQADISLPKIVHTIAEFLPNHVTRAITRPQSSHRFRPF